MSKLSETARYHYDFDPDGESTAAHIVRLVGRGKKVLELGCGPGSITRVLNEHAQCTITAIEISAEAARCAAPWCDHIHVASLDAPDWTALLAGQRFDVVVFADVLEHLRNPTHTLQQALDLLQPDGYVVISLPNVAHNGLMAALLRQSFPYRETGLLDDTHLRFFARSNLPGLLADAGLCLSTCVDVRGAPQHTEFAPFWFQLTEAQRNMLQANPEGDVYQFVIKAVPNDQQQPSSQSLDQMQPIPPDAGQTRAQQRLMHLLHQQGFYDQWKRQVAEGERIAAEQATAALMHDYQRLRSSWPGRLAGVWLRIRRRLWPHSEPETPQNAAPQHASSPAWGEVPLADRISHALRQYDLPRLPLISIVIDVGDQPIDSPLVRQTVESLQGQTYVNYQLLFNRHATEQLMPELNGDRPWDARWSSIPGAKASQGLSALQALDYASGEFILQLSAGDRLHASALQTFAEIAAGNPAVNAITFNHDGAAGECILPQWNAEFHLAHNVVGRAVAIRAAALAHSKARLLQAPDAYAWMLAVWAEHGEASFQHLNQTLLWHGSSPMGDQASAAAWARRTASERYPGITFEELPSGHLALVHALPDPAPLVSIIIPTRNAADLVKVCLDSLLGKTTYENYEILLVDNGSDDPEALALFEHYASGPKVRVLRDDAPFNFSALNNRAAKKARGDYLLLLNNDTEVITPDWLERMLGYAALPDTGAVGARLWYPNNTLQHGGVVMRNGGPTHQFAGYRREEPGPLQRAWLTQRYLAVTAACLMVKASHYWQVGGLDEAYSVGFNDVDFCLRLHASGLRNIWVAQAELYHHESPSRGFDVTPAARARAEAEYALLCSRWESILLYDTFT